MPAESALDAGRILAAMTTVPAERMAGIVAAVAPGLRNAGFRRRRHAFNRPVQPGLVHVIDFQMGSFGPPGSAEILPWRPDLYGRYTINLGVYVDEVAHALGPGRREGFVPEYACEIRARIGQLAARPPVDLWLALDRPADVLAGEAAPLVFDTALAFLDGLADRTSILGAWQRGALNAVMTPRAPLAIAVILDQLGETEAARTITRAYLARDDHAPGHRAWAEEQARRLDLA